MEHQSIEKMRAALETQSFLPVIRAVKKKSVENEVHFVRQTRMKRVDYFPFWRVRFVLKINDYRFKFSNSSSPVIGNSGQMKKLARWTFSASRGDRRIASTNLRGLFAALKENRERRGSERLLLRHHQQDLLRKAGDAQTTKITLVSFNPHGGIDQLVVDLFEFG